MVADPDRIWVYAKQDGWSQEFWHQADKAEWVQKSSDGRPTFLLCTFQDGWSAKVALSDVCRDTRNVINKVAIKVSARMLADGGWEEWEFSFHADLIKNGNRDYPPPPAPIDDNDRFIDDGIDDDD